MAKVAFILGAGAHRPFGFPLGNDLKTEVAQELVEHPLDDGTDSQAARIALLDCGVSIDRFLASNKHFDDIVRPQIARCLIRKEQENRDAMLSNWLGYLWPSLIGADRGKLSDRFVFITFNYDRTLEYRLARACAGLWGMKLDDACNMLDTLDIYHVYGSFGAIGPASANYLEYGRQDAFSTAGRRIKIIGEHTGTTTQEVLNRLEDANPIFMLGCGFHPENMALLAFHELPDIEKRKPVTSCKGFTAAEIHRLRRVYPYLEFCSETFDCENVLRELDWFQNIR